LLPSSSTGSRFDHSRFSDHKFGVYVISHDIPVAEVLAASRA